MTSYQRVLTAAAFQRPDRIPRFDDFWEFPEAWKRAFGESDDLTDIRIWVPEEGIVPSWSRKIKEENGYVFSVDSWGRTRRRRHGAYFYEVLDTAFPAGCDVDSVAFDAPDLDERYLRGQSTPEETARLLAYDKSRFCVFGKTGGPYIRSAFVRGQEQFLVDVASDPQMARALVDRVADHLTSIGCEEIRRWNLHDTGIWIYDDMGSNFGPMVSPESFEQVLLPAYRRMVRAYKDAGARYVFLHSDGDIRPLLDMLVDAGIAGLNPLEKRAGMDIVKIRMAFPTLILAGGMDNTDTLIHGPKHRIERETKEIIDLARDGGIIIGTHSISPEIPLEHFQVYDRTCRSYGSFD